MSFSVISLALLKSLGLVVAVLVPWGLALICSRVRMPESSAVQATIAAKEWVRRYAQLGEVALWLGYVLGVGYLAFQIAQGWPESGKLGAQLGLLLVAYSGLLAMVRVLSTRGHDVRLTEQGLHYGWFILPWSWYDAFEVRRSLIRGHRTVSLRSCAKRPLKWLASVARFSESTYEISASTTETMKRFLPEL